MKNAVVFRVIASVLFIVCEVFYLGSNLSNPAQVPGQAVVSSEERSLQEADDAALAQLAGSKVATAAVSSRGLSGLMAFPLSHPELFVPLSLLGVILATAPRRRRDLQPDVAREVFSPKLSQPVLHSSLIQV